MDCCGVIMDNNLLVCYQLDKLKEHEKNYITYELEIYTIVNALKMWRNYLMVNIFDLIIDCVIFKYLFYYTNLKSRHGSWKKFLS